MKVGTNIKAANASWSFGKDVPKTFSKHIKSSVPFYEEGHDICLQLSDFFLKENSNCYDFGCSTGTLINKLSSRVDKKINFYGVDSVKEMINQANRENKKLKNSNKLKYTNENFLKIRLKKSDLIISYYTMQFIAPKFRQNIVNKIYKSLNWGGAFLMFEKIRASDARFQDIFSITYNDFKLKNNFTPAEIIYKTKSLKGVMEPFSDFGNIGLIKRAGFKDVISVFQWLSFKGYLCIK
jgi:tRNA (cmo5U34)-methyltransferase|tara:strand:+ start:2615 stop:3328 length:714 start_codon:yes stop_codon:yes gene_type:complete